MFVSMKNLTIKKIGVIGCGWLGLPLAKTLTKLGFTVNGTTTNPSKLSFLKENNIVPFLIQLKVDDVQDAIVQFLHVDLLVVNVPPGRATNDADTYLNRLTQLRSYLTQSPVKKIIFISSTSVYAENNSSHTESSKNFDKSESSTRLKKAEEIFEDLPSVETTIIRMSGLIGPDRHPGRFFAGKQNISNGLAPVNLIHLDDCIGIICKIIKDGLWNDVFNGAAPTHPSKMDFYDLASIKLHGKQAEFIEEKLDFKIINGDKITSKGYNFKHPDLMHWLQQDPQN